MRIADAMIAYLESKGVDTCFFLPGGGAMHLNDALAQSNMKPVHCHHEQSCGIAAEAWGRVKGMAGFAMVTTGPGATNILTPLAGAFIESTPLFIISGQVKRSDIKTGSGLRQKGVQEVDIKSMAEPVCKYVDVVLAPEDALLAMAKAWRAANSGRKGPVWIDVPLDVQGAEFTEDLHFAIDKADRLASIDESKDVKGWMDHDHNLLEKAIAQAKKPLLLIGHGVRLSGQYEQLLSWAQSKNIPAVFTWNAMDMLAWDDPLNGGRPGVVAPRCSNFIVQKSDVLIVVGARMDNIVTAYNPKGFAKNAFKIAFDIDEMELKKLETSVHARCQADVGQAIDILKDLFERTDDEQWRISWLEEIKQLKMKYPARDGKALPAQGEIGSSDLAKILSEVLQENQLIITGSSGLCVESFYAGFENKKNQRIFLTSGLGSMGYGLPAAIGACAAEPDRSAILVESDGSMMLNLQEFATLYAQNPKLVVVLMDNSGYASIRATQRNYFSSRFIGTGGEAKHQVSFPKWDLLMNAFSLNYMDVSKIEDLRDAMIKAQEMSKHAPVILRVSLTKDESLWPKCAAIPLSGGAMMSMPLEDMSPLLSLDELSSIMDGDVSDESKKARNQ